MGRSLDIPPVWAVIWALVSYVLAKFVPIFGWGDPSPAWLVHGIPVILAVAGFGLVVWAAIWFRRKSTPIEPNRTPKALIVEGPYRVSRNPIYTGMAMVLLGFAIYLGTASAFVGPVGFVWIVTKRFIVREEALLRQAFGAEADAYIQTSRRW